MTKENNKLDTLRELLIALGDDELILGHRASEWCGHAPILEEDIAFANLALDEIGHANLWYSLLADLEGKDRDRHPDQLVFWREDSEFRNAQMVELPIGDWAFSILRQYLFDSAEIERLKELVQSNSAPVAEVAAKIQVEELYHIRHSSAWVRRLGLGTNESHKRMQAALDQLWHYTPQLFMPTGNTEMLLRLGINIQGAYQRWHKQVVNFLISCRLQIPEKNQGPSDRSKHTSHLNVLVREMQSVVRLDSSAKW